MLAFLVGQVFSSILRRPGPFWGCVRKSCARIPIRRVPSSVRRAPNRTRNLGQKNADFATKTVDFDVPESDFRAAAQHGLMRGGGRPSTTSSRARRTPSRRHRGSPAEADQHYKLGFQPIPRIRVCDVDTERPEHKTCGMKVKLRQVFLPLNRATESEHHVMIVPYTQTISTFILFKFSGAPTQLSSFKSVLCAHESIFLSCFPVHIITVSFFSSLPVFFLSFPPFSSSFSSLKLLSLSYEDSSLLTTTIRMPGRTAIEYLLFFSQGVQMVVFVAYYARQPWSGFFLSFYLLERR